ncbi:BON domain-containing protein [Paraburkholderia strydomiana]|jgi:osmotically-inducible protein OsmY|uniref:BON domain-containing protein n=1 Tax=Paraburkholderia strydomiana TaxID=1245417 RepID=UPI0038BCD34B
MSSARVAKRRLPGAGWEAGKESGTGARLSDAQIAAEATRRLAWDAAVPEHCVKVRVSRGRITLHGELQRPQQKTAALEDVARLFGVTGVLDHTVVKAK